MDHSEISMEAHDASWRVRCNERMERLKNTQFSSSDSPSHTTSRLLQARLSVEKKFLSFEMYQSVKNKNADEFVDQLEKIAAERRLSLPEIFDQVTVAGDSLLHLAIRFGADDIAELICIHSTERLLVKGDSNGDMALHIAAREKNSNVIELILSQYTAEKEKSVGEGNAEISLEKEGNELTRTTNDKGDTPLHEAVYSGDNFQADKSIAHHLNKSGKSPLYIAVQSKCTRVIDLLLEASFIGNPLPSVHGISPLHAAISERDSALLIHILEKSVEVMYLRDEHGRTPLHYAASEGYLDGVRELLHRSTQIALEWDKKGHLPIHLACKMGHVQVVEEFLKQKWPKVSDMLTSKDRNILHIAVKNRQSKLVKYLLSHKNRADKFVINGKDKNGNTALHLASMRPDVSILRLLCRDDRVDFKIKNNDNFTASGIFPVDNVRKISQLPLLLTEFALLLQLSRKDKKPSQSAQASRPNELSERERIKNQVNQKPNVERIKDRLEALTVVATLIVTVTFAAGFTVPGGVYSSDKPGSEFGGLAVFAHTTMFKMFIICNTIAMYSSTFGCMCLVGVQFSRSNYRPLIAPTFKVQELLVNAGLEAVGYALLTMSLAFMAAVRLVARNIPWLANLVTIIAAVTIFYTVVAYMAGLTQFMAGLKKLFRRGLFS